MLKGIQRRMVEVRTDKSGLFETAYFVLRDQARGEDDRNIVDEAYRIISYALEDADVKERRAEKKKRRRKFAIFSAGFLCGAGVAVSLFVLGAFFGI